MLETLRGDQTLDLRSFGVRFLALALGLDFTTNDEFADLLKKGVSHEVDKFREYELPLEG